MAFTLSGLQVAIRGALRSVYEWPVIMLGLDASGNPVPITVSAGGGIVPSSTTRTFALASTTSASGTIMAGANSGSIILSADFVGSIAGKAIDMTVTGASAVPFESIDIPLNGNDTLVAVAYTRSAGTIWYANVT